jgi:hypothetical protein
LTIAAVEAKDSTVKINMTPAFRIPFLILISWTLLFFIYPKIAGIIGLFGISALFFYGVRNGMRKRVIKAMIAGTISTFERDRQPFMFWFFILLYLFVGLVVIGLGIFCIHDKSIDLLVHYF